MRQCHGFKLSAGQKRDWVAVLSGFVATVARFADVWGAFML